MDENGNTKPTAGLSVGGGVYGKAISGYILTTDAPLDVYTNSETKTVSVGGAVFLGYYHVVIIGSDGNIYSGKMFTLGANVGFSSETNAWWK